MRILILGAGQVGSTAAYQLARQEANEVTIVDKDATVLRGLQDRLDIRTVVGHAAHPNVLQRAGAKNAEMVIALTSSDEVNMIACQVAYTFFGTPTKIGRIRSAEYLRSIDKDRALFAQEAIPVDVTIAPEQLVTEHIQELIHFPGAFQVLDFAEGKVRLVGARALSGGLLVDQQIKSLKEHIPGVETRIAAIYRQGQTISPDGSTLIRENDEVFFIAARDDIRLVMGEMRRPEDTVRRVTIAGGGAIGFRLARRLEQTNQVKVIERNQSRAKYISERLSKAIVLHGDAADEELLLEENIDSADVFVSLTNAEEANILSAMLAKKLGCNKVMALINRPAYADLVEESGTIDVAVSPQQITISALLSHVRRGDVVKVHSLRRGRAEAIEAIAHGTSSQSRVVGRHIEDIALPDGVTISAIFRKDRVLQAHHDTVIETGDHVIMFITDRRQTTEVERLFEVDVDF
ncbi:MAG: Trk system potassium transporter TrkA [Gammaproteobacteria bacterium]|nr:Trk system potassium transporter TrkA [Gammaproteobacteria bacterium]